MKANERRTATADQDDEMFMFRADELATRKAVDGETSVAHPSEPIPGKRARAKLLTPEERQRLHHCEKTIREGLGTFIAVGSALMEIRDSRLYRQTHRTFKDYVQSVLALSRPRAYELIDSAQVMTDLSAIAGISLLPQNEGQARELRRWKTPEARVAQWKTVLAAAGDEPLTAKFIPQTLRPAPATAGTGNTDRGAVACLTRLRSIVSGSPAETKALNLISKLEEILSKAAEKTPKPTAVPKTEFWLPGFEADGAA